jgi:hypothetical protein
MAAWCSSDPKMRINSLVYIVLGIAVGVLYRWAFDASRSYKELVAQESFGRNRLPLANKIVSIAVAGGALLGSMIG